MNKVLDWLVLTRGRKSGHAQRSAILLAAILAEVAAIWLRTGRPGGYLVVRCRERHLFTTIWIPAASIKSLRFGLWRLQRCPVGHHWSLVTPVNEAHLTKRQRRVAGEHRDIRVP